MGLIEEILVRPKLRQKLWAWWYPFFTRRIRAQGVDFLNYAFEEAEAPRLNLAAADEPDRPNIQLYENVRGGVELRDRRVLEVSCGHGGGASYFARTYRPAEYVGLDLNPEAIRYGEARHQASGLRFQVGDAQRLPFADSTSSSTSRLRTAIRIFRDSSTKWRACSSRTGGSVMPTCGTGAAWTNGCRPWRSIPRCASMRCV